MNSHKLAALKLGTLLLFASGISAIAAPPDLTTGGVPTSTVTTNLGPTGLRGWVYHESIDSSQSRQIQVQVVDAVSPAAGILAPNDVILGADGTGAAPVNFTADARRSFANAINDAEARTPAELKVLRWRAGITTTQTLTLRNMGVYSATAPYNCPKSAKILEEGIEAIMTTGETAGAFSLGTLTLLAANNPANPKNAARQTRAQTEARALIPNAAELANLTPAATGFLWGDPWGDGHKLIVLTEYYLQTNDALVLPAIQAYSKAVIGGQNLFGTYSHVYSSRWRDGTPNGPMRNFYGTVNNASMPGWLGLLLTKECGVINPDLAPAIERPSRFYSYYSGKGAIPYGEHDPGWQGHENNGKSGLAALCYELESHRAVPQKFFAKMAVASTTVRDIGHTGPYFNHLWAPLGAAVGGETAAASHFSRVRWMLDLNRRWNGLFISNRYGEDSVDNSYSGFSMSTPILLTYALPLRQLHITGRGHDPLRQLSSQDVSEAEAVDGYEPAPRTTSQLITDLGSWSPTAQRSAALELGNRPSETTALLPSLHAMATNLQGTSRVGATFALGYIGHASSAGILAGLLTDPVNHVRFAATEALREMPQIARSPHLNTVLAAAVSNAAPLLPFNEEDPAHMTHSRIGPLLFGSGGMVPSNLVGMDRNLVFPAIRAVAQNPVGYCRSSLSGIYNNLSQTDYQALADTLVYSAYELTPADKMFAYEDRFAAQRAMRRFNTAEGVPLCLLAVEDAMYGDMSQQSLSTLQLYAGSSKTVQPDPDVEGAMNFLIQSGTNVAEAQAVLAAIAGDPNPATLQPLKSIQSVTADAPSLTLPANSTTLRVTASDLAKGDSVYTWRKVHGKSNVTFTPNGTAAAKDSTVLINGLPGQYRFEVTMSDSRDLTEVSRTVNVTLYDSNGTLPPNSPPVANPQSLTVVRAFSKPITLSGSDPEGFPLTYRMVSQPSDGVLSGTLPNLTYTPEPDGVATSDSFTFEVMDSEGQIDVETISLTLDNTVRADGINWGTPTNTTGPTSIVTTGTFVNSRTGSDNSGTITVNGVSFFQGKTLANSGADTSLCPDTGTGAENIALESLLDRISWGGNSFQITGLTPGTRYLIQIFLCDFRATRQMVLSDEIGGTDTATLTTNPAGAFGQNVIGTFTAGSSSQTIYVEGVGGQTTHLNAWQLRQVPDGVSPTPSPLTWATPPTASGMHAVNMTASTATDASGVEYYFDETSGNAGGTDSGWQDSPSYTDTLLTPGTTYTYRVTARDKSSGRNTTIPSAAATVTTGSSNLPRKVWNVNIGSEITTSDNFIGATTDNTTNSTWNSVVNPLPKTNFALLDSSGAATTARLDISALNGGNNFGMGTAGLTSGDEIFRSYIGGAGATVTMLFHGLPAGHTYDLIVYSDWFWKNGDPGYPVTQTIGTGLSGTIYTNRSFLPYVNGQVPPLQQDPNPANVMGPGNEGNWYRIRNLSPDASGQLGFRTGDGVNGPINGFQLIAIPIDPGDLTPPAPNPMTWATAPAPSGQTSITMTATTASDVDGVQYFFEETSGNPGAGPSTWQDSPVFTDAGLTIGMTYTYRVKARDKSPNANETGWSPAQSVQIIGTSPSAPANLAAAPGNNSVSLTWTLSPGAASYHVKRALTSGGPYTVIGNPTTASYNDSTAVNGTTYYYVVSARNSVGESANSGQVSAVPVSQPSATTLVSSPVATGPYGSSVIFTATVTVSGGPAIGTVTFRDGATVLGSGALSAGTATFATSTLTVASHSITATYGGDSIFSGSVSPPSVYQVTPKALAITGVTATNKIYDGNATATLSGGTVSGGVIGGETVTVVPGSGTFASANAGTWAVTATGYSLGGANAGNYTLSSQPTVPNATITPRPLQLTGTRAYDGTVATGVLSISNNLDGGNLTLTGSASLSGKNVGSQAIIMNVAAASRVRSAKGNTGANAAATISVNMAAAPAAGNTMIAVISTRGTSANIVSSITQTGVPNGTWVRASQSNNTSMTTEIWYASNVPSGTGTAVTINQASFLSAAVVIEYSGVLVSSPLDQIAPGNSVGSSTAAFTGTTPATTQANELWIGGIGFAHSTRTLGTILNSFTAVDNAASTNGSAGNNARVYALERIVSSTGAASSGGTISASTQWASTIATFKTVTPTTLALAGPAAANYTLTGATGTVQVTPKALAVSSLAVNPKAYDGTPVATLNGTAALLPAGAAGTGTTSDGKPYTGDALTLGGTAAGAFSDPNVGSAKAATMTGLTLSGADSGNYTLTQPAGLTADITPTPLTVTASNQSKTFGQTVTFGSGSTQFTNTALQNGETIGSVTLTCAGGEAAAGVTSYPITPSAATGGSFSATNYAINYVAGTLTISAAATSTTLSTSGSPSTFGGSVTLTATVVPASSSGTVQFYDNTIALGGPIPLISGQAQLFTSTLSTGNHSITATYSGSTDHTGSTAPAMTQTVDAAETPFEAWAANPAHGLAAGFNDGPLDDPDLDGFSNLLEFVLGGMPMDSSQVIQPKLTQVGANWEFSYHRSHLSTSTTIQIVEQGGELSGWTPLTIPAATAGTVTIIPGPTSDHVKVTIPPQGTKGFARLKVAQVP